MNTDNVPEKSFRLIIAGGRDFDNYDAVKDQAYNILRVINHFDIEIVSGGCSDSKNGVHTFTRNDGTKVYGADGCGERLAKERGLSIKVFDADWNKHGKSAGPIRNTQMAEYATNALIFSDGQSRGTNDIIKKCKKQNISGTIINYLPKR